MLLKMGTGWQVGGKQNEPVLVISRNKGKYCMETEHSFGGIYLDGKG
jgi:hypothetical protein